MELNALLDYYKDSGDLNAHQEKGGSGKGKDRPGNKNLPRGKESGNFKRNLTGSKKRFLINLGEKQNLNKGALLRLVCSESGIESYHMGRIEIHSSHAFFEVDAKEASRIFPRLKEGTYEGKNFEISPSGEKYSGKKKGKKKKG